MKEVCIDLNEEKAVAIMLTNLKQPKNSELLDFADACGFLKTEWGFKEMAKYFKTSQYMLRQIDKINELKNSKIRNMIKDGKLKIDSSYQIWKLPKDVREEVADIVKNMPSQDIRSFVQVVLKNPKDVSKAKKIFEKTQDKKIRLLILPLSDDVYDNLYNESKKSKKTLHDFALKILEDKLVGKK